MPNRCLKFGLYIGIFLSFPYYGWAHPLYGLNKRGLITNEAPVFTVTNVLAPSIWQALRQEMHLPQYIEQPAVQAKLHWFEQNPWFLKNALERAAPYLYYIMQQVKARHMPIEFALIPIIESAFNPFSVSPAGAAGIWQLMPATAADYGIRKNYLFDGRRDVLLSTQAALSYLRYLQNFFGGNALLALAAYNTGQGNILKAVRNNIARRFPIDFWSLPIAQETKDYVPSLLALAYMVTHFERYAAYFPAIPNEAVLVHITLPPKLNFKLAGAYAGINKSLLKMYNPGVNNLQIYSRQHIILPRSQLAQYYENISHLKENLRMHWFHYRYQSRDTLPLIAQRFHVPIAAIRNLNQLSLVKIGSDLIIPVTDQQRIKNASSHTSIINVVAEADMFDQRNYHILPGDTVYMIRAQDSLASLAKKFHISDKDIIAANPKSIMSQFKVGKQLVIPTHITMLEA